MIFRRPHTAKEQTMNISQNRNLFQALLLFDIHLEISRLVEVSFESFGLRAIVDGPGGPIYSFVLALMSGVYAVASACPELGLTLVPFLYGSLTFVGGQEPVDYLVASCLVGLGGPFGHRIEATFRAKVVLQVLADLVLKARLGQLAVLLGIGEMRLASAALMGVFHERNIEPDRLEIRNLHRAFQL